MEKNEEKENKKSEEKKKGGEENKNNGCTPSLYVDFFGDSFWKKKAVWGERSILAVRLLKSPALIYINFSYPCR